MNAANASLQVGAGVGSTITTTNFTQGTIQTTGGPLDAAIQGNGFFVVQDAAGTTSYTRDGSFSLNSSGQLVTSTGDLVQGWTAGGRRVERFRPNLRDHGSVRSHRLLLRRPPI